MIDKFKECEDDYELDLAKRSPDENASLWEDDLERFRGLFKISDPDNEMCFQCKKSIVSWDGNYLLCSEKGIILKDLK